VRVDRRAGVAVSSADTSLIAPAADAIAPGLLAEIEQEIEGRCRGDRGEMQGR
jgi:hypothetical protein